MGARDRLTISAAAAIAVTLVILAAEPREGVADPYAQWWTIETDNFIIHYPEPIADVARRMASIAERSHKSLTAAMESMPTERTHVILRDVTDSPNGFAQTIPRNSVTIFVTAPEGTSQLMDHDDWLYGLFFHEYAHIVHLDYSAGLPRLVNRVVGKTWSPNQVQPRWVIEGVATYQESKRTSSGRVRLTEFESSLRMLSVGGNARGIDQISSGVRTWPHGTTAYQYGGHFLTYVFDAYGDDKLAKLSSTYGSNPIPWAISQSFEAATGKRLDTLYSEFADHVRGEAALTTEAVERAGRREGERMTFTGETNAFPKFRRDKPDEFIWLRSDGLNEADLVAASISEPGGKASTYVEPGGGQRFAVGPDGSVVYSFGRRYRDAYSFRDLFHYDPKTRKLRQLTEKMRASEPALSPSGDRIAFIFNRAGRRALAVMPAKADAKPRLLWRGGRYEQAYEPAWSPDGKHIAFSAWRDGGHRDIVIVDVESGKATPISHNRAQDLTPVYDPQGRYLYFVSDRDGVYNVYAAELDSLPELKLWQVTNVVGGVLQPDVSPDGKTLVFMGMVSGGYDIFKLALDPSKFTPALPFINDRPAPVVVRDDETAITKPRKYRPIETLAPQSYEAQLLLNSFGQAVSVSTEGEDILGRHGYTLTSTFGLDDRNVDIAARYRYTPLWPNFTVAAGRRAARRGGFVIDGVNRQFTEEELSLTASAQLPIIRLPRRSGSVTVEYALRHRRDLENPFEDFDPNEQVPEFPETDIILSGVRLRWNLSTSRAYTHTLGPVSGMNFSLSANLDHPVFGSDFRELRLAYAAHGYTRVPRFEDIAVSLRLTGGIGLSDRRRRPAFSFGGVRDQEIIDSVINTIRISGSGYLRGFESGSAFGSQFMLANLELRREIARIERGLGSLPIYVRRLHIAGLVDVGNAWRDDVDLTDLKLGVGGALRLDAVFGYFSPGSFDVGYARGVGDGSKNEFWFLLTTTL